MKTFKKFNEAYPFVTDPYREGSIIWNKTIKINETSIVKVIGSVDGVKNAHTAVISIHTKSIDQMGEEFTKEERIIIHQQMFNLKDDAIKHVKEMEKKITYIG